ncbi:YbhB/YbcL family Raf kinase inhibitor-like protein [Paenibacillus kobensis]|uniref:YbhB/YbcL family Raf kinase inhibitor-like protein n=1 Tax=Paenibacillus kobensis TaxID=59841 RepID=UPI000FD8D5EA|nr:YbhB/YbcL family Raf kinase inhibitor-like protein [Paenibacillus kobensis]
MRWRTLTGYKMMLITVLAMVLSATAASAADKTSAAVEQRDVMHNVASFIEWNSPFTVNVNGKVLETKGEMINSRWFVPVRAVFEAAGANVTWDAVDHSWHAKKQGEFSIEQKVGDTKAVVNGGAVQLDSGAVMADGTVLAPARVIEAALGLELRWDSANRVLTAAPLPEVPGFRVWSDAFPAYGDIPTKYAHGGITGGKNISLPISWEGAPKGTKSFAVVMYDVNPIADSFVHWSVLNIPVTVSGLPEGSAEHFTDGSVELNAYFGMEPPRYSGDHLYRLVVYALDTDKLEIPEQPPTYFDQLEPLLLQHSLGYAVNDGFFRH